MIRGFARQPESRKKAMIFVGHPGVRRKLLIILKFRRRALLAPSRP